MIYDLIEVTPKINKKKVICAVLIVLVLILLIIAVIKREDILQIVQNTVQEENTVTDTQIQMQTHIGGKTKIIFGASITPMYTEKGRNLMQNIYASEEKTVYLTFDDGPSKTVTPLILDLLKKEDIKATFFVLGARAELNPNIIKREYTEGHFIANHGYSHIYGNIYSSPQAVLDEYNRTKDIVNNILNINYNGYLFRFPGGSTGGRYQSIKKEAKVLLDQNNIASIDWNALSSDAAGAKTKEEIIQNTIDTVGTKNSVVILMHDAGDKILTYEALPEIIAYLKGQGYTFKNFYSIMK